MRVSEWVANQEQCGLADFSHRCLQGCCVYFIAVYFWGYGQCRAVYNSSFFKLIFSILLSPKCFLTQQQYLYLSLDTCCSRCFVHWWKSIEPWDLWKFIFRPRNAAGCAAVWILFFFGRGISKWGLCCGREKMSPHIRAQCPQHDYWKLVGADIAFLIYIFPRIINMKQWEEKIERTLYLLILFLLSSLCIVLSVLSHQMKQINILFAHHELCWQKLNDSP
jgi:hypothetical protein